MAKKKSMDVYIPGVIIRTSNDEVVKTVNAILETGQIATVVSLLFHKLAIDTSILDLKESSTDVKLSKTIESVSSVMDIVRNISDQLSDSNKQISNLRSAFQQSQNNNTQLTSSIAEIFSILQTSQEGLEIMKKISTEIEGKIMSIASNPIVLPKNISASNFMDSSTEAASSLELKSNDTSDVLGISSYGRSGFDTREDEEDELLDSGLGGEELSNLLRQFRPDDN